MYVSYMLSVSAFRSDVIVLSSSIDFVYWG